ncbi:MAG TPA: NAD(P)-dependent oxidoreductase [Chroococcales cyanobacterium]
MTKTVFLAGASGAIGKRLSKLLVADRWRVVGMTHTENKMDMLRELGVEPVCLDVFDPDKLKEAVAEAAPDVVIHQLTDLPPGLDPELMKEGAEKNARIWDVGTRNLIAAASKTGARRLIAQSIAFVYDDGMLPHLESDPLKHRAKDETETTVRGVTSLEEQVVSAPMEGIVLRYGLLYGPGTGFDEPSGPTPLHVDAAAKAAHLAIKFGHRGIYNVAEDDGTVNSEKARRAFGWVPQFRIAN